jgi:hypothetical protein
MMGDAGPLADSIAYCENQSVLKLPTMPRLPGQMTGEERANEQAEAQEVANSAGPSSAELARQAVDNVIAWGREHGIPLSTEGCVDPLLD